MNTKTAFNFNFEIMRSYFDSGATISYEFRLKQLKAFKKSLVDFEDDLCIALFQDLRKNKTEAFLTEIGLLIAEVNLAIRKLSSWMRPKRVGTNLICFPSDNRLYPFPKGVVLIIGAWNYPLLLSLAPVIGAIAGGNCVVLKPSEHASASALVIEKILKATFSEKYISVIQGEGSVVVPALLNENKFDHVFYTGGVKVGQSIYELAAKKLVPVTLELGGKSPTIVESDADIKVAAKRIVFGKFMNAGQTCVAPDYLLVHESVQDQLMEEIQKSIKNAYGDDIKRSNDYGRIINKKRFDTLVSLLKNSISDIVTGGEYDEDELYFAPTIVKNISLSAPLMQDEIFGPILPIFSFNTRKEAFAIVANHKNPLAFYLFTSSKSVEKEWLHQVSFGNGCINNTVQHLANPYLPFGGIGNSGIGGYRGKYSFKLFTHARAVMKTPTWIDPAIKYPPYGSKLKWLKKLI